MRIAVRGKVDRRAAGVGELAGAARKARRAAVAGASKAMTCSPSSSEKLQSRESKRVSRGSENMRAKDGGRGDVRGRDRVEPVGDARRAVDADEGRGVAGQRRRQDDVGVRCREADMRAQEGRPLVNG